MPDPRFVYLLADPTYIGAVAREVVDHYGDEIGAHPVGTGAFRLKSWRRASRIVLERSPTYRGLRYDGTPADDPLAREIAAGLAGKVLPLVDEVVARRGRGGPAALAVVPERRVRLAGGARAVYAPGRTQRRARALPGAPGHPAAAPACSPTWR
jgi:hypothetical protein